MIYRVSKTLSAFQMPDEPLHLIQIAIARTGISKHVACVLSLRRYLSSGTRIIASGRAAPGYRETLERIRSERLVATTAPRP